MAILFIPLSDIWAQSGGFEISGQVSDENGDPIIGANVIVKGSSIGGITDIDGNFTFSAPDGNGVLTVSYIGYVEQNIPIEGKHTFNIILKEDNETLEEVVVVGYGVQKRAW